MINSIFRSVCQCYCVGSAFAGFEHLPPTPIVRSVPIRFRTFCEISSSPDIFPIPAHRSRLCPVRIYYSRSIDWISETCSVPGDNFTNSRSRSIPLFDFHRILLVSGVHRILLVSGCVHRILIGSAVHRILFGSVVDRILFGSGVHRILFGSGSVHRILLGSSVERILLGSAVHRILFGSGSVHRILLGSGCWTDLARFRCWTDLDC